MIITDLHIHSTFSSDAVNTIDEIAKASISKKLQIITITDHIDIDFPSEKHNFKYNFNGYSRAIKETSLKYKNNLQIYVGLEVGLQPYNEIIEKTEKYISGLDPDFIIGSTHCVFKEEISKYGVFKNRTKIEAYNKYLEAVLENIKLWSNFDVVGHLDFIERYYNGEEKFLKYSEHKEIIDEILKNVILKGKGLEINSSGYRYNFNNPHPSKDILKRYRELGGEIITIGSDSHHIADLASNFSNVEELLKELGFKYYCYFTNRKVNYIKL